MASEGLIIVTGAGGFVGRSVCARLRTLGATYVGRDRARGDGSDWQSCDISDGHATSQTLEAYEIQAVIHLAAVLPSASRLNPMLATKVNIFGSINLLEAAIKRGARRFVFASSMSVYGSRNEPVAVSESCPAAPDDLYGAANRYVEMFGETLQAKHALQFTALRIATVVGAGARGTASPWRSEIFEKLGTETDQRILIPFRPEASVSLVHVEDVAEMLVLLTQRREPSGTIYNSPAETWRVGELKRFVEELDGGIAIDLDSTHGRGAPPLADGGRFLRDFGYHLSSLAERLTKRAQRSEGQQR